jgi:hypothetical protein
VLWELEAVRCRKRHHGHSGYRLHRERGS